MARFLFVIFCLINLIQIRFSNGQCPIPTLYQNQNQPDPTFSYFCGGTCTDTLYLEYGPMGFTPGTAGTPGAAGTLIQLPFQSSTHAIVGLPLGYRGTAYVRRHCNSTWSQNSLGRNFGTTPNCFQAPSINCGFMISVNPDSGGGAWSDPCSFYSSSLGYEKIYKFTATQQGMHQIFIGSVPLQGDPMLFYYKAESAGCTAGGWNCIGYSPTSANSNAQLLFGPLVQGETYFIRVDHYSLSQPYPLTQFMIVCPDCPQPQQSGISIDPSPYILKVNWNGPNGFQALAVPQGNFPNQGAGGYSDNGYNGIANISGLNSFTNYDVYVSECGFYDGLWSQKITVSTATCPFETYVGLGQFHGIAANGHGYDYSSSSCFGSFLPGKEKIIQFTPPVSGYFDAVVQSTLINFSYYFLGFKKSDGNCNPSTYSCTTPLFSNGSGSISHYRFGPLQKDTTYDFYLDHADTSTFIPANNLALKLHCPIPDTVFVNYLSTTSVEVSWHSLYDSVYVEYGPPNLIPGTNDLPGSGGTVLFTTSNSIVISGLDPNETYYVYIRNKCGGSFSPNSTQKIVYMDLACSSAPIVTCGTTLGLIKSPYQESSWSKNECSGLFYSGKEKTFQFTATDSGMYHLYITYVQGAAFWNSGVFYRESTSGCSDTGWVCIGNNYSPPELLSFGPLDSGKTYTIMFDGPDIGSGAHWKRAYFYCPVPCLQPFSANGIAIADSSVTLNVVFMDSPGTVIVEYGPSGFTPGTDLTPGAGGTVVTFASPPYVVENLSPVTTYDFYIRQQCLSGTGFSTNIATSATTYATLCGSGPTSIYSNNGDTLCQGAYTYLSAQGIIPSVQNGTPSIVWFADSCFATPIDTANFISVIPLITTTYYAIAFDSCGYTTCVSKTIHVLSKPNVNINPASASICPGDSILLDAGTGFASYAWNNGNNAQQIYVVNQGNYIVTITDQNGCTNKDTVVVTHFPIIPLVITGVTTICPGQSTVIDAGSGYVNYLWSIGANTQSIQVSTPGTYTVTVSDINGCILTDSSVISNFTPTAISLSTSASTDICQGDSILISANTGMSSYQWIKNNIPIANANSETFFGSQAGWYKCFAIDSNGCESVSDSFRIRIVCIPIGPNHEKIVPINYTEPLDVSVYPNPSSGGFNFYIDCSYEELTAIQIFDQQGRKLNIQFTQIDKHEYRMDKLSPGIYFAEINCTYRKKVLKIVQMNE